MGRWLAGLFSFFNFQFHRVIVRLDFLLRNRVGVYLVQCYGKVAKRRCIGVIGAGWITQNKGAVLHFTILRKGNACNRPPGPNALNTFGAAAVVENRVEPDLDRFVGGPLGCFTIV